MQSSPYTRNIWILDSQLSKVQNEYNDAVRNASLFSSISNSNPNKIKALEIKKQKEAELNNLIKQQWLLKQQDEIFQKNATASVWDQIQLPWSPASLSSKSSTSSTSSSFWSSNSWSFNKNSWVDNINKQYNDQISKNEKTFDDARTGLWLSMANRSSFNLWWGRWVSEKVIAQNVSNANSEIFDKLSAINTQKESLNSSLLWQKIQAEQNQQQLDQNNAIQKAQVENQARQIAMAEDQRWFQKWQYARPNVSSTLSVPKANVSNTVASKKVKVPVSQPIVNSSKAPSQSWERFQQMWSNLFLDTKTGKTITQKEKDLLLNPLIKQY